MYFNQKKKVTTCYQL